MAFLVAIFPANKNAETAPKAFGAIQFLVYTLSPECVQDSFNHSYDNILF